MASDIPGEFEPLLAERVALARAAWPAVRVAEDEFVRAIVHRLADDAARSLQAMHTDDLYLAIGCAAGDLGALAGFEARCGPVIARAMASSGASEGDRADIGQIVRQRLLVAPGAGGRPRIATYSARGSLQAWVRIVATREVARVMSRARREVATNDDELGEMIGLGDDPRVSYLKHYYREEFKLAFHAATEALDAGVRLLLQQHMVDGLSLDQIAALHNVHRATAARRVEAARQALLAGTKSEMIRRLRLSRDELASVLRLIGSRLDVTLPRVLPGSPATS